MSKEIFGIKLSGKTVILRVDTSTKILDYTLDGGTWITISGEAATTSAAGLMSATDKTKLDGLGAAATTSAAGLMSAADKTKLDSSVALLAGATFTGAVSFSPLTASTVPYLDASKNLTSSAVTPTELLCVQGVTSGIQSQLNAKAASGANSDITSLSGLTTALSIAQGGTGLSALGTAGQVWTVNSGATAAEWSAISTSSAWSSITGKPTVLAHYNGTISDDGIITLENSVSVADIAIGSAVKFTTANTAQGIVIGDVYIKKLQSYTLDPAEYDNATLVVSGAGTTACNGTYHLSSDYGQSGNGRRWIHSTDATAWIWWNTLGWTIQKGGTTLNETMYDQGASNTNPWEGTWRKWYGVDPAPTVTRPILNNATDRLPLFVKLQTYSNATISAAGLMSSTDKTKIDALYTSVSICAQTSSYTLVLDDKSKLVTMSNESANTLTIPLNSSVAYPVGSWIDIITIGAGTCTITADSGVTLNGTGGGTKPLSQWAGARLYKIAENTWITK